MTPESLVRYQYDNHLGSACLELDASAAIISYEEYHPFGTTSYRSGRSAAEVSLKRYKYVSKERDEESGLYYYGARYYAAWLCRFVSVDPLQFKYPHYTPYQYAGNKPISFFDIDGLEEANNESKTNFFIKKDDTQAKTDIENLAGKSKYIDISATGAVSMSDKFNNLKPEKQQKLLGKNEGLNLIHDLSKATYKDSYGLILDAKILYQTEEPMLFSGWRDSQDNEPIRGIPSSYPQHFKGENAVNKDNLEKTKQFSYNASITTYGTDSRKIHLPTLLPQIGFQGQVAIAPGKSEIYTGATKKVIKSNPDMGGFMKYDELIVSNTRTDLVKHELRENLFRTQEGFSYGEAHNKTLEMYFQNGNKEFRGSIKSFIF